MCAIAIQQENYWYYSNGSYELESTQYSNGTSKNLDRHITGPISRDEIFVIINNPSKIDPNSINWQSDLIVRLTANRFNTNQIIEGLPQKVGMTKGAYAKSFLNWTTAGKTVLVVGGVTATVASPGLLAHQAPSVAARLGWPAIGEASVMNYSIARWSSMLIPATTSTATSFLRSVAQTFVITIISKRIFGKLNETCGPKGFRAWKVEKMDIFIQNRDDLIPEKYENDPVLGANTCPINCLPIRVPCKTSYGHVFEESAIKAWLAQQVANNVIPTCPLTRQSLTQNDLTIDYTLSDRIELRLLALESQ